MEDSHQLHVYWFSRRLIPIQGGIIGWRSVDYLKREPGQHAPIRNFHEPILPY
jgi:hypothetical protein